MDRPILRRLARSALARRPPRRLGAWLTALVLTTVVALLGANDPGTAAGTPPGLHSATVTTLLSRARDTEAAYTALEGYLNDQVEPLAQVLMQYREDPRLARRIAVALVRESNRLRLDPRLMLAVLLVENPALNPRARSSVGALGLMQVMPFHRGSWPCGSDLTAVDTNICYGTHIFASDLRSAHGNVERALLRYNGCVVGANTPDCRSYPSHVFARAGKASLQAWGRQTGTAAER